MAMSQEHGSTLQEVQQLMKKNQVPIRTCFPFFIYFFSYLCNTFTFALLFIVLLPGYRLSAF